MSATENPSQVLPFSVRTKSPSEDKSQRKLVMFVAAEASSALFAQRLMEFWQKKNPGGFEFFGVGTEAMEKLGLERLGKSEEMAVVGASEILDQFGHLKKVFDSLVQAAKVRKPDLVILLDYPEFNLYLARKLYPFSLNVVYYVSPQVWAWRQGRVKTIRRFCKKALVIFPFEVDFYKKHQVPVEFVGHPILDELKPELFQPEFVRDLRARRGWKSEDLVLCLMPGSRRSEIRHHLQVQLRTAALLVQKNPRIKIMMAVAPTIDSEWLKEQMQDIEFPLTFVKSEPFEMIAIADAVLVASGTASLQVALLKKPMVIMYKMTSITYLLAKLFVRGVKFFGLPNLVMGREIVPECWQDRAEPEVMAPILENILTPTSFRKKMIEDLEEVRSRLGSSGATEKVAKSLEEFL